MSLNTSDATFKADVLESTVPVLVDFWAPWCGPCKLLGPIIDRISEKTEGQAKIYKLNVDENPATTQQYGITAIPTVIIFRDGQIVRQFTGLQPEKTLVTALIE